MNRWQLNVARQAAAMAVLGACIHSPAVAQAGRLTRDQFVGAWMLTGQWVEQDGKKIERFGSNPRGMTIFDPSGHFVSILLRGELPKFASGNAMTGTAEENKAIVQGSTAFYGRWNVNDAGMFESQVIGATFPGWDGTAQKRQITFAGDQMTSCVPGAQIGGTACAVYKRVK
jgi:hypothetical protein